MIYHGVNFPDDQISAFCVRHQILRLSLFGSILGDSFTSGSDIDMLVEFQPHARLGLIEMAGMSFELSELLGRSVDLRTPNDLSQYFRDRVMAQARLLHAA